MFYLDDNTYAKGSDFLRALARKLEETPGGWGGVADDLRKIADNEENVEAPHKLAQRIAEEGGYDDPVEYIEAEGFMSDTMCPGICKKCQVVHDNVEQDARDNWCDECNTPTVVSLLVLLGIN